MNFVVRFAKDVLSKLPTEAALSLTDKFERKISWRGVLYVIYYMLYVSKIVKSLENSGLLINGATELKKHEITKTKKWISWCYDATYGCFIYSTYDSSLIQPVSFSLINAISG